MGWGKSGKIAFPGQFKHGIVGNRTGGSRVRRSNPSATLPLSDIRRKGSSKSLNCKGKNMEPFVKTKGAMHYQACGGDVLCCRSEDKPDGTRSRQSCWCARAMSEDGLSPDRPALEASGRPCLYCCLLAEQ
ncbi:hypothetical protein ElyMa_003705600 [Elysia marginata]|uniref:Uncharacterized protein n=1 Tax=Elysia marginata TaxID=1093978 RepID=A0AAV4F4P5_9GAST|nr:hypothetical protein ElyMa_003705600 [Elysia marginata]